MLVPAALYKDEIIVEMKKRFYTDDMLYETGSLNNWLPDISEEPDASTCQYAIVDNGRLVGYLGYCIDWYTSCASRFGLMSFDKGNRIIGIDVFKTMRKLLYEYKLHRVEFRMIGGNPVERHYDKICNHFGGIKHILTDAIRDSRGNYHNDIIYEIIRKETKPYKPPEKKKTYKEDFLEKFPNTFLKDSDIPWTCRDNAYGIQGPCENRGCVNCWNEVMPDE